MIELSRESCAPCREGAAPISDADAAGLMPQLPGWLIVETAGIRRLTRTFKFPDFARALAFTNQVGALAESADHHPEIVTAWGQVTVTWWTHAVRGLHRNDFIMAARTDRLVS